MPIISLATISALSGYALYQSYQNITRLRQYEERSEKAAKWSNTVAKRLHKTRSTQTSGTLTLMLSLGTAIYLVLPTTTNLTRYHFVLAALVNAGVLFFSHAHMAGFWNDGTQIQVPFVEGFNEAIKGSEAVVRLLGLISYTWGLAGGLWVFGIDSTLWAEVVFTVGFAGLWATTLWAGTGTTGTGPTGTTRRAAQ